MRQELTIDSEFDNIVPSISPDELKILEEQVLKYGLICPIVIWNNVIVDGHNRYRIIHLHPEIELKTYEMEFGSREEAIIWICKNQLGRRNLSESNKRYLIGKQYETEKKQSKFAGNRFTLANESRMVQNEPSYNQHGTRSKIAQENNVSESYVLRANEYQKGVDIADKISPGIKDDILTEKISPKNSDLTRLTKLSPEEQKEAIEELRNPEKKKPKEKKKEIPVDIEESILDSMVGTVNMFVDSCNNFFTRFPKLRTEEKYRERALKIMEAAKKYIIEIEGALKQHEE